MVKTKSFIPRETEKLGNGGRALPAGMRSPAFLYGWIAIGQGGSPDFLAGARGIAKSQDPKRGRKIWGKADAGQNQFFRHERYMLFSGSSHQELAKEIAKLLKIPLGKVAIEQFPDGEIGVQILENVRGRDVFVLQSAAHYPNHYFMELLILVDALKRASCRSIAAVMPYYPYARQDRKEKGRVPITAKLVADLLEKAGVDRLLTMDLHAEQIQGFFEIPVDNLSARPLFAKAFREIGLKEAVVVSPDVGRNRMARKFAEDLDLDLAIIDKRRNGKVEVCALIGDVEGKTAILPDDICSTGKTLEMAAKECRKAGAKRVIAAVAHGLKKEKVRGVDQLWITNSVPNTAKGKKVLSVAPLFADAIDCIVSNCSISSLF